MASTIDYVEYIMQQLAPVSGITCRRMFGEYGLHCNGKFFACICDNQLLVKATAAVDKLIPNCPTALPYEGASTHYYLIEDIDNSELICAVATKTCELLPEPKPKKKKAEKKQPQ